MLNFLDIQLFIRVSETGGISSAARKLGLSTAAASAAIKRLERHVDSQLFERSTRSLRLTQSGENFLNYCVQSVQSLEEGMASLKQGREKLSGDIHLAAPSDLGRDILDELLESFRKLHPEIRIIMHLSDVINDLYRNPIDIGLRYGLQQDSGLIAKKLCDVKRVICAASIYLEKFNYPKNVLDLVNHNCICFYRGGELFNHWKIVENDKLQEVIVSGDRAANDGALARKWALNGHGIIYKSRLDILHDLESGKLIDVFPEAKCETMPLYAVYPSRQYQPARIEALLSYLQDKFELLAKE
jgi:DNA-binding transcriptional LysR family regulator